MSRHPLRVSLRAANACALVTAVRRLTTLRGPAHHAVLVRAMPDWAMMAHAIHVTGVLDTELLRQGAWRHSGPRVVLVRADRAHWRALDHLLRTVLHDARPDTVATIAAAGIGAELRDTLLRALEQLEGALAAALIEPAPVTAGPEEH